MSLRTSASAELTNPTSSSSHPPHHDRFGGLAEWSLFARRFVQRGVGVASLSPSSRSMARAAASHVSSGTPQNILELGAGTGPVTVEILRRMHPQSRLIALELDPLFVDRLRHRCPRAEVFQTDAAELPNLLDKLGLQTLDVVINGLPTPSLPRHVNEAVFSTLQRFAPYAPMTQLTTMPLVYKPLYHRLFHHVKFEWVFANMPPAGVYHLTSLRPTWRSSLPGKPTPSAPLPLP